jgi:ubiquinone/menaquinone biosynthesis C-methylase UbiE
MNHHEVVWDEDKLLTFNDFYNQTHDKEKFSGRINSRLITQVINKYVKKNDKILDIGVGGGHLMEILVPEIDCYGIDISRSAVDHLKKKGIKKVKIGSIEDIPFDIQFDIIILMDVIEHLSEKQLKSGLENIRNHLTSGGYFIITTPFEENLNNHKVICPDCGAVFHSVGHVRSFEESSMKNLLEKHSFNVEEIGRLNSDSLDNIIILLLKKLYRIIKSKPLKSLSQTMYVISYKI